MKEQIGLEERSGRRSTKLAATLVLSLSLAGCAQESEPVSDNSPNTTVTESAEPVQIPESTSSREAEDTQPPLELVTPSVEVTTDPEPEPEPNPEPEPDPEPTVSVEEPLDPTLPVKPTEPPMETSPGKNSQAVDCMVKKCIALTFDDGPGPYTEQLLDYLDDYDAKATFFVVGSRVGEYDDVAKQIHQRGHQIGAHSWDHDDLTSKGSEGVIDDTTRTNQAIFDATGVEVEVMRPPYGATNQSVVTAVDMPQILWSVDTEDWRYRDSDRVAEHVKDSVGRGDIVLMHDIHKSSVNAVPEILESLTEDGYEFVTVDTLLGDDLEVGRYNQQDLSEG